MNTQQPTLSHREFMRELTKEHQELLQGGTSYRAKTAEMSLEVARIVSNLSELNDRMKALHLVSLTLPNLDEERLKDVSKMLSVVANDLHLRANQSDEIKAQLERRAKRRRSRKVAVELVKA